MSQSHNSQPKPDSEPIDALVSTTGQVVGYDPTRITDFGDKFPFDTADVKSISSLSGDSIDASVQISPAAIEANTYYLAIGLGEKSDKPFMFISLDDAKKYIAKDGKPIAIGRGANPDGKRVVYKDSKITIDDNEVSKSHGVIGSDNNTLNVEISSTNPSYLIEVSRAQERIIDTQQAIKIGEAALEAVGDQLEEPDLGEKFDIKLVVGDAEVLLSKVSKLLESGANEDALLARKLEAIKYNAMAIRRKLYNLSESGSFSGNKISGHHGIKREIEDLASEVLRATPLDEETEKDTRNHKVLISDITAVQEQLSRLAANNPDAKRLAGQLVS